MLSQKLSGGTLANPLTAAIIALTHAIPGRKKDMTKPIRCGHGEGGSNENYDIGLREATPEVRW